ncbi:pre-mRNA cleavage complex 2 protein Pcf11 isoform X1 [Diorhabda sublineata]|uniref:pre-mRNA cleavage complex 2 protein Pcf11 isoform X1 n=1 Tax=Diorhabda sublineata TaxID=1163346 RepID=UPI0024E0F205|nr:pre-mRNA cleavage complex 2 protein Pcf11 isoform X1 [Diorhabda sublineata]XP_056632002.1 pre-mRNA cleavage complex 2 protein Pcf11 isoform X1 [Diorhabda sublineata]
MSSPEEIKAEYSSSLADLTFNSKPLINVLTMLADENSPNANVIVEAIEEHLSKVHTDVKLPILYLIDCIVKNVGGTYTSLFSKNIVTTFIGVFKATLKVNITYKKNEFKVDEKTRAEMFKLRQTWNEVFPQMKLYAIDVQINQLDPAWPVTAKLPSNSIHLNPKFLKPTSTPSQKGKTETEPTPVIPGAPAVDKETLLMQEQLIQKQKELLELQQKRLELEVLQTQVKLQEQIKQSIPKTGRPQNILLKPEVAKQLVPTLTNQKSNEINTTLTQQQKPQQMPVPITNGTKINPVSSALINAKPIRDPRLMRQQQKQQQEQAAPIDGNNAENQLNQRTALLENNKIVTNKVGVRKVRNDPRLINKNDNLIQKSDSPTKSNTSSKSRNSDPAHKSHKSSRISHCSTTSDTNTNKSGSTTTLGLPKLKNSDIVKSPSKQKRKDDKQSLSNLRNKREKMCSNDDVTIITSSSSCTVPQATFKSVKSSMKNRNYVKRNLGSASPEVVQDEDLRSLGPPEKQSRLLGDPIEEPTNTVPVSKSPVVSNQPLKSQLSSKNIDVDLRQLPAGVVGKKRTSTESPESTTAKKNKSEILDKLFGDEDTDLRQLSINSEQRPKTPPPPIISSNESGPKSPSVQDSPKSNLDAIRAKLANATNRDKVLSKSYNKKKQRLEDQDLRQPINTQVANKIIISPEDENNIKSGKMTNEESSKLLNKIILQMEKNKLKEAKRKDNESSFNTSLQPISDEEFNDSDFEDSVNIKDTLNENSPSKDNENISSAAPPLISEESLIPFNDKDERLNTGPLQSKTDYVPQQFYPRDGRRFPGPPGLSWRGGRGNNRRNWDPPQARAPIRLWNNNNAWAQSQSTRDFDNDNPVVAEESESPILNDGFVNVDEIKSMAIDGISRDIRFYGETAIVFVGWDDPRELTFQNDGIRKIIFNDTESFVLGFNDDYKEVSVNGKTHLVKIGAPSREIFIDSVPYECFFGSPGIRIQLDGVPTKVQLEGPPPPVNIGKTKRTDIVAGKINMVINAKVIVPVFLDAKPQKFVLDGETSTLKFVDALKTVLINDVPFNVEYGGLPKPLLIHDKKHFIRFSVLPKGIKPGKVKIIDMEGDDESRSSPVIDENSQDETTVSDAYDPGMPITGMLDKPSGVDDSPDRHSDSPNFYQKFIQQQQNNLDVLSNAMTPTLGPTQTTGGYQVENNQNSQDVPANLQPVAPTTIPTLNINDLFQKLVASGFVTSTTQPKKPATDISLKESTPPTNNEYTPQVSSSQNAPPTTKFKKNSVLNLKRITFERPETLRVRQSNLYNMLYSGMQCSTCGMRFTAEASMLYSQHLDWHFRQNRRGKKNSRVATSRRWYYSLTDWKNYEELEDLEEREKNYFDEQKQAEGAGEDADEDVEIPSVAADPDSTDESCVVCRDKFDQFFNEEKEEWHLKNAIRIDDKTYHPVCYEDFQQSLLEQTLDESIKAPEEKEKQKDKEEVEEPAIPGLEIIIDDDDEELEKESQVAEVVSVESDESKLLPDTVESSGQSPKPENMEEDDDDDVILNEVAPIKIVVDDDDDEDMETIVQEDSKTNAEDDGFVEIAGLVSLPNGKHVKIKAEPMDKELDGPVTPILTNDLLSSTTEENDIEIIETTRPKQDVIFSMDGNVEPASGANPVATTGLSGNRIKINISKPLPVINKEKESTLDNRVPPETYIDPFEPFPPGEEPEPATLKPALKTVKLKKLPPIRKGTELTGLCSLM